jgi:hypothetical protein
MIPLDAQFGATMSSLFALAAVAALSAPTPQAAVADAPPAGKWFDRVLIMMFENHAEGEVIADPNFHK